MIVSVNGDRADQSGIRAVIRCITASTFGLSGDDHLQKSLFTFILAVGGGGGGWNYDYGLTMIINVI